MDPIEEKHHATMNALAEVLQEQFKPSGFALLVFDMNTDEGRMNFISNADRGSMLKALKEFIANAEGRAPSVEFYPKKEKPPKGQVQVGRLAIRTEGDYVNAYYAMPDTMKKSLLLFTVDRGAADLPNVRDQIIKLGTIITAEMVYEVTGVRPEVGSAIPAPEYERTKNA